MDLDAIEQRTRAATEGPWHAAVNDLVGGWCVNLQGVPLSQSPHCGIADFVRHEDAQFIAHARTDVPALVARVRELEQERDIALADARREEENSQAHADDAHQLGYHCALVDAIAVCETEGGDAPAISSRIAAQIRRLERARENGGPQ